LQRQEKKVGFSARMVILPGFCLKFYPAGIPSAGAWGVYEEKKWVSDEIHLEFVSSQSKNLPFSFRVDVNVNFW